MHFPITATSSAATLIPPQAAFLCAMNYSLFYSGYGPLLNACGVQRHPKRGLLLPHRGVPAGIPHLQGHGQEQRKDQHSAILPAQIYSVC